MPKFSIIVPIYNSSKTIRILIESILAQDFNSYEVLLIDDGSIDESVKIINGMVGSDDRFRLIKQENRGVSSARNRGLDIAQGRIVTFIDSDDYIEKNYLSKLNEIFDNSGAEMVFMEFNRRDENGNIISAHHFPDDVKNDFYDILVQLSSNDMFGYTWLKAIRKDSIGNIRFNENIHLYEDEIFTCHIMKCYRKIAFCHEVLYNYVKYEGETLTTKTYEDYPLYCDNVYQSWKKIIPRLKYESFLQEKANHIAINCKWYLLERNISANNFAKKMAACEFICDCVNDDKVIGLVKNKKWITLELYRLLYKFKVHMKTCVDRGNI